jgi:hypothetical protein
VVSVDHEIVDSYVLPALVAELGDEYKPIAGASALLAYDARGDNPVPGYQTFTDAEGLYKIATKSLPRSPHDDNGWYFLIIEKDGYRRITKHMGFGFMSGSLRNTVVLKPISPR